MECLRLWNKPKQSDGPERAGCASEPKLVHGLWRIRRSRPGIWSVGITAGRNSARIWNGRSRLQPRLEQFDWSKCTVCSLFRFTVCYW